MPEKKKSITAEEHKKQVKEKLRLAVITVSDSKFEMHWKKFFENKSKKREKKQDSSDSDISGKILCDKIEKSKHELCFYSVIPDNREIITGIVKYLVEDKACDAVIITGGTGLSERDVTIEAINSMAEKHIPGFGEIFRAESYKQIGSPAILSRAEAIVFKGSVVFALPGSPQACELGFDIIQRELSHMVKHARS